MMRNRLAAAVAAAVVCGTTACTSTSTGTAVTTPTADKCQVNVSSATTSFPSNGGSGSVTVGAARDCTWSVSTGTSWIAIGGGASGQGNGTVAYSVAANPSPAARNGAIAVGSQSVALSQAGAPCRFSISPANDAVGAGGGRLSVNVSTLSGCSWTATSGAGWIAIASGASGSASGTVSLSVAANTGGARVGQLNVAGQNYTLNQDGAPAPPQTGPGPAPAPSPSPSPAPAPQPGPSPSPSPSPGPQAGFFGVVTNVSGKCPNLWFNVNGATVITDKHTQFKDISCGDVAKGGRLVQGSGSTDSGGAIHADIVQQVNNNDQ